MKPPRNRRVRLATAKRGRRNAHMLRKLMREHGKALLDMMLFGRGVVVVDGAKVRHLPLREMYA